MMKVYPVIKDYFSFNRKELRGIMVLMTLILAVLGANILLPYLISGKEYDMSGFEKEITAFEKGIRTQDSLDSAERRNRYRHFRGSAYLKGNDSAPVFPHPDKKILRIELNSADTFDLQQLRGIGPGFARRIVRYRERLGGFISKKQVLEVFGMDTVRYNGIAENLCVNTDSVQKINLNTVTFKELLSHPYFPFEITKAIMLYRKDKKKIRSIEELRDVPGMADTTFRKIVPYIRTE